MALCLIAMLLWPLYWEHQHRGPEYLIKGKGQVVKNQFGTLQLAVHDPLLIQFTSPKGQEFEACCLDYGDGKLDTVLLDQTPSLSHAYQQEGTYVVSLLIWENDLQELPSKQLLGQVEVDCQGKLVLNYTVEINEVDSGYLVQFNSKVTGAPENELTYYWTFGDGEISTEASPNHQYNAAGTYKVGLSVSRFLTTFYNCGDTAYLGSQLILNPEKAENERFILSPPDGNAPPPRQAKMRMRAWFIALLGLICAGLGLGGYFAGKWIFVNSQQRKDLPQNLKAPGFLSLPTAHTRLFSDGKLYALSQALSQVEAGISAQPRYLVLIERQTKEDLFARLMKELWGSLRNSGVELDFYYFQDTLDICIDPRTNQSIPFASVASPTRHSHLILCTDGACLIDPYQKGIMEQVSQNLRGWEGKKCVFTPIPHEDWEEIESYLTREFVICPANQLLVLPACIQTGQYQSSGVSSRDRISWKSGLSYASKGLQRYLGEDLFLWLQMTALWPQSSSDWVMHLARLFKPEDENYTYNSLIRLSRLSWMREGGLPPNLAYHWLGNLPESEERRARELLLTCLQDTLPPIDSVASLEKERYITLQQFILHPEKSNYARAIYTLFQKGTWNKVEQRLVFRNRKSLYGKSLWEYLQVRFGRLKTLLWAMIIGLLFSAVGVMGLHKGWQEKSHYNGNTELTAKPSSIWYTEIWESPTEQPLFANRIQIQTPQKTKPKEVVKEEIKEKPTPPTSEAQTEPQAEAQSQAPKEPESPPQEQDKPDTQSEPEPKVQAQPQVQTEPESPTPSPPKVTTPCSEQASPYLPVSGRGFSKEILIDREVAKDFNRLKAYARDNGVMLEMLTAFPATQAGTEFGKRIAIGRALSCELKFRKGLDWVYCNAGCLTADEQPRPIRKFFEDLERDRWWKWELADDNTTVRIWLGRYLSNTDAREKAFAFREYYEACGE